METIFMALGTFVIVLGISLWYVLKEEEKVLLERVILARNLAKQIKRELKK